MKINRLIIALALGAASVLGASATNAFRAHRYDSFKATPTEPNQIVFAGNSITNMHSWFEAFGSHQEVIGRGNSGGFAFELLDNLESYIDSKPAKFFVMIGTNDISSGQPVELTHKRIMAIVKRVRLESPDTEIYVESILPRNNNTNPKFAQCNVLTSAAVAELNDPKVHFVDLTEACAGIAGGGTWSYDKLHPRPIGYAAWCHVVDDMVGYPTVYPDTIKTQNNCGLGGSSAARVEQFPYFPVSEGDVLIFGDEQIHGGEWHELLRSPKIKDRGQNWGWGGMNLTQAKNVVNSALKDQKVKPAKIFLCYGVGGKDLTNYRALVDEAKAQAPDAKIYIMSLTPSRKADINSEVVSFNTSLQQIATEKGATYVDVYTPLNQDINLNIMTGDGSDCYVSGRGYVVMANALAPYLQEENVNPVSLEEYEAVIASRAARSIVGAALTRIFVDLNFGDGTGQIKEKYREGIESCLPTLVATINKEGLTTSEANAAVAEANNKINTALADVNLPKASTETETYWYNLISKRGNGNVSVNDEGKLVSNTATSISIGNDVWKFIERGDGTYDIVNPNGLYISPVANHNTQMNATSIRPNAGFTLSNSNATPGSYVIYSGNCQLNQTDKDGAIFNWHGGTAPNRSDEGCSYLISLFEGSVVDPMVLPYESGWYQLQREDNNMYIRNLDEPTFQASTNYWYSLQYVAQPTETPKDWVYVEVDGNNRRVRSLDGFYTGEYVAQDRNAYNVNMTPTDTRAYKIQYYTGFSNAGLQNVVGRSSSANFPHLFNRVSKETLAGYDIWTVKVKSNTAATTGDDTHVIFDSPANKGIKGVYNNGVFFVEPGTEIAESDLTVVPAANVSQALETPAISIDNDQKKIVVCYFDLEPKVTVLDRAFTADSVPYRIPDKLAEPILSSEASTAAFHITYQGSDPFAAFAAASDTTATNKFFLFGTLNNKAIAVRYVGNNNLEGHYSSTHNGGSEQVKIVVVNDPAVGYSYYVNGAHVRTVAAGALGAYGFKHFGNIDNAKALYLGGVVTDDNKQKYMLTGTIHSARFWNRALSAEDVADLSYDNLKETQVPDITGITEVVAPASKAEGIYDLTGRRVVKPSHGIYIVNGRKERL